MLAECIEITEALCTTALAEGRGVCLVLRDVSAIDPAGRELLARLAEQGVRLEGFGLYMSHLVSKLRPQGPADGSSS